MYIINKLDEIFSEHSDTTKEIDDYYKHLKTSFLTKQARERNKERPESDFNGTHFSDSGVLRSAQEAIDLNKNKELNVYHVRTTLLDDPNYNFKDNLIIQDNNIISIDYLNYLPELTTRQMIFFKEFEEYNVIIKKEKYGGNISISVGKGAVENQQKYFSVEVDTQDKIKYVSKLNSFNSEFVEYSDSNFLSLINTYGLLNLENLELKELINISCDFDFDVNEYKPYECLKLAVKELLSEVKPQKNKTLKI